MKFVIRRAVVGLISLPLVAGAYVVFYITLNALGADNSLTIEEIYNNGLLIGSVSAIAFAFATQLDNFLTRVTGE